MAIYFKIKNFRKHSYFEGVFDKRLNQICGRNFIGKTCIINAIYWCLTGEVISELDDAKQLDTIRRDSTPIDEETSVELTITTNNPSPLIVRRVMKQVDEKGLTQQSVYINGSKVGTTKANDELLKAINVDWRFCPDKVNPIASLINPNYITRLDPKLFRKLIEGFLGAISDKELLDRNPIFKNVANGILSYGADNFRTQLRNKINDFTPEEDRLNTLVNSSDVVVEPNKERLVEINKELDKIIKEYSNLSDTKDRLNTSKEVLLNKQKELFESQKEDKLSAKINPDYELLQNEYNKIVEKRGKNYNTLQELAVNTKTLTNKINFIKSLINSEELIINVSQGDIERAFGMNYTVKLCPHCNQPINEEEVENNEEKKLNIINNAKNKIALSQKKIENYQKEITDLEKAIATNNEKRKMTEEDNVNNVIPKLRELEKAMSETPKKIGDNYVSVKTKMLINEVESYEKEVAEITAINNKEEFNRELTITNLRQPLEDEKMEILLAVRDYEKHLALKQSLQNLVLEKEKTKDDKKLVDLFVQEKIKEVNSRAKQLLGGLEIVMLEDRVTTDGLKEVCYLTYNGNKFTSVSTCEKAKLGIQLIKAIRNKLNVMFLPVLLDRAEGIDDINIPELALLCDQLITTKVDSDYAELKILGTDLQ